MSRYEDIVVIEGRYFQCGIIQAPGRRKLCKLVAELANDGESQLKF